MKTKLLTLLLIMISCISYSQTTNITTNNILTVGMPFIRPEIRDTANKVRDYVNYLMPSKVDTGTFNTSIAGIINTLNFKATKTSVDSVVISLGGYAPLSLLTGYVTVSKEAADSNLLMAVYNSLQARHIADSTAKSIALSNKLNISDTIGKWLSSYTETDPLFDTKLAVKSTSNLSEGSNLYWTNTRGDIRYPLLSGSYSNPSWITGLAQSKISYTGTNLQYIRGDGTYTTLPIIPTNISSFTNDVPYLTSIPAQTYSSLLGKPTFATIATTGAYSDLSGTPTITTYSAGSGIAISTGIISNTSQDAFTTKVWSKSGLLSSSGILVVDTFSVSTASPTISLNLPTGTTIAKILSVTGYRSGATVSNSPQVCISAMTNTSVTLIISQQNTATLTLLSTTLLSGLPMVLVPDPTNIKIAISYITY